MVVSGSPPAEAAALSEAELGELVRARMAAGLSRKDAAAQIAKETGLPKRRVYETGLSEGG